MICSAVPISRFFSRRHRGRRLKSTLDIGAKQVYEVEVVTRMGEPRTVMVSVSPLHGAEGEILGVLGIARDMTETKKLEQTDSEFRETGLRRKTGRGRRA